MENIPRQSRQALPMLTSVKQAKRAVSILYRSKNRNSSQDELQVTDSIGKITELNDVDVPKYKARQIKLPSILP